MKIYQLKKACHGFNFVAIVTFILSGCLRDIRKSIKMPKL